MPRLRMECLLSKKPLANSEHPMDKFWADWFVESTLYGEVHVITNPADGGPPRVLRRAEYDITVKPKERGEDLADPE